jgi:hypothetical protein
MDNKAIRIEYDESKNPKILKAIITFYFNLITRDIRFVKTAAGIESWA